MIRTISDLINTFQTCFKPDEEVFILWASRDEVDDVTDAQWKKILTHLDKRSDAGTILEDDLNYAHDTVVGE